MNLREIVESYAGEGADFSKLDEQLGAYTNLSELTKDNFIETLKKVPNAISAYDSVNRSSIETGITNFKTGKMLDEWKEKETTLRAELNPKETASDKRIRELEDKISNSEKLQLMNLMKDQLSVKAKEMEFDSEIARKLAPLGDEIAESLMKDILTWKDGILGDRLKSQYDTKPPKTGGKIGELSSLSDSDLNEAAKNFPNEKAAILDEIRRRTMPK